MLFCHDIDKAVAAFEFLSDEAERDALLRARVEESYQRVTDAIAPGVVCCQHGWWQECKALELPGYSSYGDGSANPSLLIGTEPKIETTIAFSERESVTRQPLAPQLLDDKWLAARGRSPIFTKR